MVNWKSAGLALIAGVSVVLAVLNVLVLVELKDMRRGMLFIKRHLDSIKRDVSRIELDAYSIEFNVSSIESEVSSIKLKTR